MTRTLPLRVPPLPGEAIDSWLEYTAHRYNVPLADIAIACGLRRQNPPKWLIALNADERVALTTATGVAAATVDALTLRRFDGTALRITSEHLTLDRSFPFGVRGWSRFCPACLRETDGRWQLSWRLGWVFACVKHQVVLADECLACRRWQRRQIGSYSCSPALGRCSGTTSRNLKCSQDLTAIPVSRATGLISAVQERILRIIASNRADLALYGHQQPSAQQCLSDLQALIRRFLRYAATHALDQLQELLDQPEATLCAESGPIRWPYTCDAHQALPPQISAQMAAATAWAVPILDQPTMGQAAERARPVVAANDTTWWGRTEDLLQQSPTMNALLVKAHRPALSPLNTLRYRATARDSARPNNPDRLPSLLPRVPASLWPPWSVRLLQPDLNTYSRSREILAAAVLLVGTSEPVEQVMANFGMPMMAYSLRNCLHTLITYPQWEDLCTALTRTSDYLCSVAPPIDYQRRRQLDYSDLLTDERWRGVCRDTGQADSPISRQAVAARAFLFERVSAAEIRHPRSPVSTEQARGHQDSIGRFPWLLSARIADRLTCEAAQFLARHGIAEPVSWHPPLDLIADLDLPGPDLRSVDANEVRRASLRPFTTVHTLARDFGLSCYAVRYLLSNTPADLATVRAESDEISLRWGRPSLGEAAHVGALRELYETQGLSRVTIARRFHVAKSHLAKVSARQEIAIPTNAISALDPQWVHQQHVIERRSLKDIAAELGVHETSLWAWRKEHEPKSTDQTDRHPVPPRQISKALQRNVTELLADPKGRCLLLFFRRVVSFPNYAAAADGIGVSISTVAARVNDLELQLDAPLIHRARSNLPLLPTRQGNQTLALIHGRWLR